MSEAGYWITPLALLPGVGLIVMSTAVRFGQLHEEIHRHHHGDHMNHDIEHLFRRAVLFRNALIALYAAVALLAVSGLIGGVSTLSMVEAAPFVIGLSAVAVGFVAFAALMLIRESLLLGELLEQHRQDAESRDEPRA